MSSELARAIKSAAVFNLCNDTPQVPTIQGLFSSCYLLQLLFLSSSLNEGSRLGRLITASNFVDRTQAVSLSRLLKAKTTEKHFFFSFFFNF